MWISVKDKLPTMKFDGIDQHISDEVLLVIESKNGSRYIDMGYRETFLSFEDGKGIDSWIWWFNSSESYDAHKNVTHWQPLPPLPQEQEIDTKIYTEEDL